MVNAFTLTALIGVPLLATVAALPHEQILAHGFKSVRPHAIQQRSADTVTNNYAILTRGKSGASHSSALRMIHARGRDVPMALLDNSEDVQYLVPLKFGDEQFQAVLDTGSSDTWLILDNYTCTDFLGTQQDPSVCAFGPGLKNPIDVVPDELFGINYGDGEVVTGEIGTTAVTIAGITVPKQIVGLATTAYWNGLGVASGLVGLSYPIITSAYESDGTRVPYDPFFTSAWKEKMTAPTFALALMRGASGGYLSFGGLPPIDGVNSTFASTPIELFSAKGSSRDHELAFYAITPDAFVIASSSSPNNEQTMIDSGTTLNYLPTKLAKAFNAAFYPPATLYEGGYLVECDAKAPKFGVTIGGTTFFAAAIDLILTDQANQIHGKCVSGIQDSGVGGVSILGDVFMKSVIAVFDVGASEMRFAAHSY